MLLGIFIAKGIIAYGLWTEADWAVNFAIIDAIIGIILCLFVTIAPLFLSESRSIQLTIRLELVVLFLVSKLHVQVRFLLFLVSV